MFHFSLHRVPVLFASCSIFLRIVKCKNIPRTSNQNTRCCRKLNPSTSLFVQNNYFFAYSNFSFCTFWNDFPFVAFTAFPYIMFFKGHLKRIILDTAVYRWVIGQNDKICTNLFCLFLPYLHGIRRGGEKHCEGCKWYFTL